MAEPQEPPVVATTIPYIGHIIGLMRSKFNYYVQLSHDNPSPIFTLNMPGQKMYIITKPNLIQATQKLPKVLAFPPIEAKYATRICGVSQEAKDIVFDNVNGERGDTGLSMESYVAMKAALSPSEECDEMNRQMIQNVAAALDRLIPSTQQSVRIRLWSWFRQNVTAATTKAVYGPKNPLNDQSVVDAFWHFEDEVMAILVGVFPSITARKGIAGREIVAKAFEQYYQDDGLMTGSIFAKNRYEVAEKNGVALEDIAKLEVGGVTALVANSSPAAFWTIFFIYSTPGLLDDIRREIDAVVVTNNEGHEMTRSLDIKSLKEQCPLLTSTFQETLRYCSIGTSVREVMEDTVLDGQWLLRKGAMVQMPSRIIHKDPSLWGPDVEEFNPRRFMKDSEAQRSGSTARKRPSPACFRAFGGGTTLCPGRHFATNEILALTAMFVLRFDMAPLAGDTWSMPTTHNSNMSIIVVQPDTDFEVEVSRRKGFETGRFTCGLNGSDTILAVTVEDRTAG